VPFGPKRTAGISGHCSEAHCSEAWSIGPRRVGPRHGDLVRGMGPFGPRHVWSEAWAVLVRGSEREWPMG